MKQELDATGMHRLVNENGEATDWAPYCGICYMDGKVGHTAFYGFKEAITTPEEFVKLIATTRGD